MVKTTMLLNAETRQLLRTIVRKEQTYDDLINELVARADRCKKKGGLDAD